MRSTSSSNGRPRSPLCTTPPSRTYYDKCRARGKNHTQSLLRLARQRINVLFAMLRDGTFYKPRTPRPA